MSLDAEKIEAKIEETIEAQAPEHEESDWADSPDFGLSAAEIKAASDEAAAETEYDDTNHADDEATPDAVVPADAKVPAGDEVVDEIPDELPEGEEVETEAKGSATSEKEPEFDPSLIAAAGLKDADEAKIQFGTPKALENAVRLLDLKAVSIAEQALQQQVRGQQQQLTQQSENPAEYKAVEFKMPAPPEGEEWDETTVALARSLHEASEQRLKVLHEQLAEQQRFTQEFRAERRQHELRQYVDQFDGFVNELDEDWKPLLGEGSGFALKPDSLQLKNRVALDQTAKQMAFGRQQQKLPQLPQKELLTRALRIAFPQKQEQVVQRKVEKKVADRKESFINRPTGRTSGKLVQGADAAASYAEKWYKERGMGARPGDSFEYDEI